MKLPLVWIVAAFAAGVEIGKWLPGPLRLWVAVAVVALAATALFIWWRRLAAAWALALVAWLAIGVVALGVERAAIPSNHVTRLIAAGRLDTNEPLRWQGRLREDPMALPWGRRYEMNLEQVEIAGSPLPVSGGMRLNLYGEPSAPSVAASPPNLRAGDRVEALVKARPPRNFGDPGAFDLRGYLAGQKIDLTASLRSGELLQLIGRPKPTFSQRLARIRGDMLARLDSLFPGQPQRAAVLRAMLLGDRSFVDSDVVTAFQKTSAYHVLVVAGLHVGALVVFLFWLCRKLRFPMGVTSLVTLSALAAYVGIVQDRPPILRAALMAALYLCARPLFRKIELLNTVALAALVLLIWKPSSLADSSFQLSFVAAAVIAGLALPWMERTSAPYRARPAAPGRCNPRSGISPENRAISNRNARRRAVARIQSSTTLNTSHKFSGCLAHSHWPAPMGHRAVIGCDPNRHAPAACARLSSRQPHRTAQQHPRGAADWPDRALLVFSRCFRPSCGFVSPRCSRRRLAFARDCCSQPSDGLAGCPAFPIAFRGLRSGSSFSFFRR